MAEKNQEFYETFTKEIADDQHSNSGLDFQKEESQKFGGMASSINLHEAKITTLSKYQKIFYNFFELRTSIWGKAFSYFSLFLVVCSTLIVIISTLPELRDSSGNSYVMENVLFYFDVFACTIWSVEFFGKFYSHQWDLAFFKDPMNIIDLIALLPVFIGLFGTIDFKISGVLIILRLLRITKFLRRSVTFTVTVQALKGSKSAIYLLVLFLILASLLFSVLIYIAERGTWDSASQDYVREDNSRSPFSSIPEAFYWAITTLTTVGYGDVTPTTAIGKFISSVAMVASIISIALPTSILASSFTYQWNQHHQRESKVKYRRRRISQESKAGIHETVVVDSRASKLEELKFLREQNNLLFQIIEDTQEKFEQVRPANFVAKYLEMKEKYEQANLAAKHLKKELERLKQK